MRRALAGFPRLFSVVFRAPPRPAGQKPPTFRFGDHHSAFGDSQRSPKFLGTDAWPADPALPHPAPKYYAQVLPHLWARTSAHDLACAQDVRPYMPRSIAHPPHSGGAGSPRADSGESDTAVAEVDSMVVPLSEL